MNAITGKKIASLSPAPMVSGILEPVMDGFIGGISACAFSDDGTSIACITGDIYNSLHIFTTVTGGWNDAKIVFSGPVDTKPVNYVSFIPKGGDYHLVTCGGGGHAGSKIMFWRISGRTASSDEAEFAITPPPITSITSVGPGMICLGYSNGSMGLWEGKTNSETTIAASHTGAVTALCSQGLKILVSGSNDCIRLHERIDQQFEVKREISMKEVVSNITRTYPSYGLPFATSISTDKESKRLLVSLSSNALTEISVSTAAVGLLVEGNMKVGPNSLVTLAHPTEEHSLLTLHKEEKILKVILFFASFLRYVWSD